MINPHKDVIYNQMSRQQREQEIEQAPEVINDDRQQSQDHIPLKDQFSSDLSEIDFAQLTDKHEEVMASQKSIKFKPKKKIIIKPYQWKKKWVKIPNVVVGSSSLLIQRWVKVKYNPTEQQLAQFAQEENREKKNALEMAQSIMQEHMNMET